MRKSIVLIIIIAVLSAGVGWVALWHNPNESASTNLPSPPQLADDEPLPTTVEPAELIIQQLGLHLPMSSEQANDIIYGVDAAYSAQYPSQTRAVFSSHTLTHQSNGTCSVDSPAPPLGSITSFDKPIDSFGNPLTPNGTTILKLQDTYYLYNHPQAVCSEDAAVTDLAAWQRDEFMEAFRQAEALK